jgi:hypothetical protein
LLGSHYYKNILSDDERLVYKETYDKGMTAYHTNKKKFLEDNPGLVVSRVDGYRKQKVAREKKNDEPKLVKKKKSKDKAYLTPFMLYQESLKKKGIVVNHFDSMAAYKSLPDNEKLKYIQELFSMETDREKQFSKKDQKFLSLASGKPEKPLAAYSMFFRDLSASLGKPKDIVKIAPARWKTLDPEKKAKYKADYAKAHEEWQKKTVAWINQNLPKEQQAEQMASNKLLQKVDKAGAKRRRESVYVSSEMAEPSPKKNKKTDQANVEEAAASSTSSPASSKKKEKKKTQESIKKFLEPTPTPPPQKKAVDVKELLADFGPYPSLSPAHYFMTMIYSGKQNKPKKIAKAYQKLSRAEKKQLRERTISMKNAYIEKLRDVVENGDKEVNEKIKAIHIKNKKEQEESISWHVEGDTDKESEESSDSDSE